MFKINLLSQLFGSVRGHEDNVAVDTAFSKIGHDVEAIVNEFEASAASAELKSLGLPNTLQGFLTYFDVEKLEPFIITELPKLGLTPATVTTIQTSISNLITTINKDI